MGLHRDRQRGRRCRMDELFSDVVAQLADFPLMGRAGKIAGTRELMPQAAHERSVADSSYTRR